MGTKLELAGSASPWFYLCLKLALALPIVDLPAFCPTSSNEPQTPLDLLRLDLQSHKLMDNCISEDSFIKYIHPVCGMLVYLGKRLHRLM